MSPIDLRTIARSDVVTAGPATPASELARTMAEEGVGSVVIVEGDTPVGIVTDRDLATGAVAGGADPDALLAEDVMTADPFTVEADTGLFEVTQGMVEAGVRRVPVVEDGELAGIVALDTLLVLLTLEFDDVADAIAGLAPTFQRLS